MLPKPSVVFQFSLAPELYNDQCAGEIKRSYIYLAQSLVKPSQQSSDLGNVLKMSVRLMKPYWDPSNAAAQDLWQNSFMPWLENLTRNVSNAMHQYNEVLHPQGCQNIDYNWAEFEFGANATVRLKVDAQNKITPQAPEFCDKVRANIAAGKFGEGVTCVTIPSRESYESQLNDAIYEAQHACHNHLEDADAAQLPSAAQNAEGVTGTTPASETLTADAGEQDEIDTASSQNADDANATEATPAVPNFEIDYRIWGVEYADGRVVEFDSAAL
jgi:hypothetical protein